MITFADLKWLAGFLEGEAHFGNHGAIAVTASQVEPWPLEECYRLLGGSINKRQASKYYPGAQDQGVWKINGSTAASVMMTLYPLMSPKRKREIAKALAKWRMQPLHSRDKRTCPRGHPFDKQYGKHRSCSICNNRMARESKYRTGKLGTKVVDIRQGGLGG